MVSRWEGGAPSDAPEWVAGLFDALGEDASFYWVRFYPNPGGWRFDLERHGEKPGSDGWSRYGRADESTALRVFNSLVQRGKPLDPSWNPSVASPPAGVLRMPRWTAQPPEPSPVRGQQWTAPEILPVERETKPEPVPVGLPDPEPEPEAEPLPREPLRLFRALGASVTAVRVSTARVLRVSGSAVGVGTRAIGASALRALRLSGHALKVSASAVRASARALVVLARVLGVSAGIALRVSTHRLRDMAHALRASAARSFRVWAPVLRRSARALAVRSRALGVSAARATDRLSDWPPLRRIQPGVRRVLFYASAVLLASFTWWLSRVAFVRSPESLGASTAPAALTEVAQARLAQPAGIAQPAHGAQAFPYGDSRSSVPPGVAQRPGAHSPTPPLPRRGQLVGLNDPGVVKPVLVSRTVRPPYPPVAFARGLSGTVVLNALVDEKGKVVEIALVRTSAPDLGFEDAAMRYVYSCVYRPATKQGVPARVRLPIVVEFQFPGR